MKSIKKYGIIEQLVVVLTSDNILIQRAASGALRILAQECKFFFLTAKVVLINVSLKKWIIKIEFAKKELSNIWLHY